MAIVGFEVVKRAEQELRVEAQKALDKGRYSEVASLANLADRLARLASELAGEVDQTEVTETAGESAARTPRPNRNRIYPRFERDGDRLVKIAWSKRDRAEYQHKAPFRVAQLLVDTIRSKKGEGAKFATPDVMPLTEAKSRAEVPSYQAYLALAWLVHEGVVVKHGRDTYALKHTAASTTHLKELWESLPSRD